MGLEQDKYACAVVFNMKKVLEILRVKNPPFNDEALMELNWIAS